MSTTHPPIEARTPGPEPEDSNTSTPDLQPMATEALAHTLSLGPAAETDTTGSDSVQPEQTQSVTRELPLLDTQDPENPDTPESSRPNSSKKPLWITVGVALAGTALASAFLMGTRSRGGEDDSANPDTTSISQTEVPQDNQPTPSASENEAALLVEQQRYSPDGRLWSEVRHDSIPYYNMQADIDPNDTAAVEELLNKLLFNLGLSIDSGDMDTIRATVGKSSYDDTSGEFGESQELVDWILALHNDREKSVALDVDYPMFVPTVATIHEVTGSQSSPDGSDNSKTIDITAKTTQQYASPFVSATTPLEISEVDQLAVYNLEYREVDLESTPTTNRKMWVLTGYHTLDLSPATADASQVS